VRRAARKKKGPKRGIALLGGADYPWAKAAFEKALPGWRVINSAEAVADAIERINVVLPTGKARSRRPRGQVDLHRSPMRFRLKE